jgi:hypothetical protein
VTAPLRATGSADRSGDLVHSQPARMSLGRLAERPPAYHLVGMMGKGAVALAAAVLVAMEPERALG